MKLTERQRLLLFQILMDSLCIADGGSPFRVTQEGRRDLANDIINSQDDKEKAK